MGSEQDVIHILYGKTTKDSKKCSHCKELKLRSEFYKARRNPDGLAYLCKVCCRASKQRRKERPKIHVDEKQCTGCGLVKSREQFQKNNYTRDGLRQRCRACEKLYYARLRDLNPTTPEKKRCSRCGQIKSQHEFKKARGHKDNLESQCKECRRLANRVARAIRQAEKVEKGSRGPGLYTWDQVGPTLREMAVLQGTVNSEKAKCKQMVRTIKADAAELLKPYVVQQSRLQLMVERFIKRARRTCEPVSRQFRFGSVSLDQNRLDIQLNVELAQAMIGKP